MKKIFLLVFIILDGVVIAAAALFLIARVHAHQTPSLRMETTRLPISSSSPPPPTEASKPSMLPTPSNHPATASTHKILFAYRNSRAKEVMIRADFTGWKAEPMQKGANNRWTYTAPLEPGEYAYVFSVDGRSIRDPANKHVKQVGKTYVSSVVVKPAAPAAPVAGH